MNRTIPTFSRCWPKEKQLTWYDLLCIIKVSVNNFNLFQICQCQSLPSTLNWIQKLVTLCASKDSTRIYIPFHQSVFAFHSWWCQVHARCCQPHITIMMDIMRNGKQEVAEFANNCQALSFNFALDRKTSPKVLGPVMIFRCLLKSLNFASLHLYWVS